MDTEISEVPVVSFRPVKRQKFLRKRVDESDDVPRVWRGNLRSDVPSQFSGCLVSPADQPPRNRAHIAPSRAARYHQNPEGRSPIRDVSKRARVHASETDVPAKVRPSY